VENSLPALENFNGIVSDDAMPRKRVSMLKIHDLLRLHCGLQLPQRQIARSVKLSQSFRRKPVGRPQIISQNCEEVRNHLFHPAL
jgi:hypothetical protein